MAEYISRETMIKLVRSMAENAETNGFMHDREVIECVMTTLVCVPLADVAPVVHGHWVDECKCSACGEMSYEEAKSDETDPNCYYVLSDYCPNCGAKMDEEEHHV